jgi:aminoglycoside 2'-N-acetyltransferase I
MDRAFAGHQVRLRRMPTAALTATGVAAIRDLLWAAFTSEDDAMTEADWEHALGGTHFLLEVDGAIACHAAVVEREIHAGEHVLRAGYVEAVAKLPALQGRGLGTRVMTAVNADIRDAFEIGVLGTGAQPFYERLGWRTWQGPTFVREPDGLRPTPDEDGFVMVLATPATPALDPSSPLTCDWRPGDAW